jgi:hypothetical protein
MNEGAIFSSTKPFPENAPLRIVVCEPWDFGTGPFKGNVVRTGPNPADPPALALLIRLSPPVRYRDVECEYFVARPRLEGGDVAAIAKGGSLTCCMTCISAARAAEPEAFDVSGWRGWHDGAAVIASISPWGSERSL